MFLFRRLLPLLCLAPLALACAGCVTVACEHPLSDDKTSAIDERLVGKWEAIPDAESDRKLAASDPTSSVTISKHPTLKNTLEFKMLEREGKELKQLAAPLYCITIGKEHYISLLTDKEGYQLCRYEVTKDGAIRPYMMKTDPLIKAVEQGALAGTLKPTRPAGSTSKPNYSSVHITATPDKLREFVEKQGADLFEELPLKLERAKEK